MTTADVDGRLSAPDTKAGRLQRALLDYCASISMTMLCRPTVVFLFYELEQKGVVPKHYL